MKSVVLTGATGLVGRALTRQLPGQYEVSGLRLVRMDEVLAQARPVTWQEQLEAYRQRLLEQVGAAIRGKTCVAHLGWNTRGENFRGGLDPLNILVTDCVYRAAIALKVPRIYMASSVHAYDFYPPYEQDVEPIPPFPDVRQDPFGVPPTCLYGVSKRWMEIAGQYYARQLGPGQCILVVRLGDVTATGRPDPAEMRLWNSHPDLAGLLRAFIECADAPPYWVAYSVSDNRTPSLPRPLFDTANPYGFWPADNAFEQG
ncbi:MAG: NAD(P)-dependent oxidoreductase [Candidatus Latescibacterota bacterium]